METKPALFIPGEVGEVSDGYHTFNELYEHRIVLFIALAKHNPSLAWRSRMHHDGKGLEGWFIAGLNLPSGIVSYHLPDRTWPALAGIQTLEHAPEWDGHTSTDVLKRLISWMEAL